MGRYFKYILLATFIIAVVVIVFLQFNSNRSINQLINGNENLLGELNVKNNLQQLQTGIVTLESKVRGTVIEGADINSNHIQNEINNIQSSVAELKWLREDEDIAPLIDRLKKLVASRINFNQLVLDIFSNEGKAAAEDMINTKHGNQITDSIKITAFELNKAHELDVKKLINEADANGQKAKTLGSIMALMAALASIFTFGYVAFKVREQQKLIGQLNASEAKAREAVRIKENFLANMSHEIRTPMNALLGFTNLLQRKQLDEEAAGYVQTIQKSGENLLMIINDILDLSKIEAGMMRIEEAPFSIRGLVHSVETMFSGKLKEKGIRLVTHVDASLPDTLEGDAVRLTQILINLLGNALKFTEQGTISIDISNEGATGNSILTGIRVSDTGIGIEKEKLVQIFDRFQQAEDSMTRKYGGTGLGLSIVKDLVDLQNGKIAVQSETGKGTVFTIQIPYILSKEQVSTSKYLPSSSIQNSNFKNITILVVEDNEMNQSLVTHLFNSRQLLFDMANNGKEAIDLLQRKSYSLVLLDIQMPEMDGYSTAREIRDTLKLDTPIIAMTAHAFPGEREKCISYGMNEYISKPIREERLFELIATFTGINNSQQRQENKMQEHKDDHYRFINLQYMKEVSNGDIAYEKTVTDQFIEMVPEAILLLESAFEKEDYKTVAETAHNLKTSIAIMGLDKILNNHLDMLEGVPGKKNKLQKEINYVKEICTQSLEEAKSFLATLT